MQNAESSLNVLNYSICPSHFAFSTPQRYAFIIGWRFHDKETAMSCQKGKRIRKAKPGEFRCKDCDVVAKRKKKLCNPKKVKDH